MTTPIHATASASVQSSPAAVWLALRRWEDMSWTQGAVEETVAEGQGVGMVRRVRVAGSDQWQTERLTECDDDRMTLTYVVESGGMPGINDYRATVSAAATDQGTEIRWDITATTDEAQVTSSTELLSQMSSGMVYLFAAQFRHPGAPAHERA
ncbi:MAG: SRPBCC family protein [Acidimicrobiales bacterium]